MTDSQYNNELIDILLSYGIKLNINDFRMACIVKYHYVMDYFIDKWM